MDAVLRDLELLTPGESWADRTFAELDDRVKERTSAGETVEDGLRRWSGGLQEADIIHAARQTSAAAAGLAPIAWLLAERRVEPGIRAGRSEFSDLSHQGAARIGFAQVVSPRLASFRRGGIAFHEAAAEISVVTVEQHLKTAWSRLAIEGKDVAVILSDGNRWAYRKPFPPGRTNSRLSQVSAWFRQLGLVDDQGLTPEGRAQRDEALASLAAGPDE